MLNKRWDEVLKPVLSSRSFKGLMSFIKSEYEKKTVLPEYDNIFKVFEKLDYDEVLVVVLGQDPYHGLNESHGLAFSVREGVKMPPSLRNIFKELESDLGITRSNTDLTDWVEQGIFLLNAILTVEENKPLSHKNIGWEKFTDQVISLLNEREQPIVFLLWGNYAKGKKKLITNDNHYIIESVHPSPLSAFGGFFGSKPFSRINKIIKHHYNKEIKW